MFNIVAESGTLQPSTSIKYHLSQMEKKIHLTFFNIVDSKPFKLILDVSGSFYLGKLKTFQMCQSITTGIL